MNRSNTGSAGNYRRTKTPNSTGRSRYIEYMGPGNTAGFYAFLSAAVNAGQITACEQQRRVWAGK